MNKSPGKKHKKPATGNKTAGSNMNSSLKQIVEMELQMELQISELMLDPVNYS